MASPIKPGLHNVLQRNSFWVVPALTQATPKKTEIEAVGGLYITCFLTEDGSTGWTVQFNKGTAPRLICNASTPEVLLPSSTQGTDLIGAVDPQAASGANDKKAFEFLRNGYSGYMVRRQNVLNNASDLVTVGEFVDSVAVDISPAIIDQTASSAEGVYVFKAGVAVTADPVINVAVIAGP